MEQKISNYSTIRKPTLLLLNYSFWPDYDGNGQSLTELCEGLGEKYHITALVGWQNVSKEVFKGRLLYRENYRGINILRVRHTGFWKGRSLGRLVNWLSYSLLSFFFGLRLKPDIIIATTQPPILGFFGALLKMASSKSKFIYNIRDMYPDVAIELGVMKEKSSVSRIYRWFNDFAYSKADVVLTLGESMEKRLHRNGVSPDKTKVITHWADIHSINPVPAKENQLITKYGFKDRFILMYSGNFGLAHDFRAFFQALKEVEEEMGKRRGLVLFVGDGAGKPELLSLIEKLQIKNIQFMPYQPKELLSQSLGMADLHLISMKKGVLGTLIPGKFYSILAAGKPYLAIVEQESELGDLARRFGCGSWVEPGNVRGIKEKLLWALNNRDELVEQGKKGRALSETNFNKGTIMKEEWYLFFDSLLAPQSLQQVWR